MSNEAFFANLSERRKQVVAEIAAVPRRVDGSLNLAATKSLRAEKKRIDDALNKASREAIK